MKLTGTKRKGRHLPENVIKSDDTVPETVNGNGAMALVVQKSKGQHLQKNVKRVRADETGGNADDTNQKKPWIFSRVWKKALIGVGILAAVAIAVLALDVFAKTEVLIKPPAVKQEPRPGSQLPAPNNPANPGDPGQPYGPPPGDSADLGPATERIPGVYTFLVLGIDGLANTDAVMVVQFDTSDPDNYKFNVVAIPRDTMVNADWASRKVNQVMYQMRVRHRGEDNFDSKVMQSTVETYADILGFEVDYWFTVNMRGFAALVDAIGGVDFYIPTNMYYHDPAQNLLINYRAGMHRKLTGAQALEILRFRRYSNADIGRIDTQQNFLKAAAEQILAKRNSINVLSLAEIFFRHVNTDLTVFDLAWLGMEFLKLNPEDITFMTLPGIYNDYVNSASYVTILVDDWLEMVNTYLNPFSLEVTSDDVSILARGADRRLYVTDGNRQGDPTWGASSRGPDTPSTTAGRGTTTSQNPPRPATDTTPPSSSTTNPATNPATDPPDIGDDPDETAPPDEGDLPAEDDTPEPQPQSDSPPEDNQPPDDNPGDSSDDRQAP